MSLTSIIMLSANFWKKILRTIELNSLRLWGDFAINLINWACPRPLPKNLSQMKIVTTNEWKISLQKKLCIQKKLVQILNLLWNPRLHLKFRTLLLVFILQEILVKLTLIYHLFINWKDWYSWFRMFIWNLASTWDFEYDWIFTSRIMLLIRFWNF